MGFTGLDEETVGKLMEEDGLGVVKEEEAFEGSVGWIKGDAGAVSTGAAGADPVGVMEERYLEEKARGWKAKEGGAADHGGVDSGVGAVYAGGGARSAQRRKWWRCLGSAAQRT